MMATEEWWTVAEPDSGDLSRLSLYAHLHTEQTEQHRRVMRLLSGDILTREMSAAFREAFPRDRRPLLVVGGPRFDEAMTSELGVDRIFGKGTTPGEVASYLVSSLVPDPSTRKKAV